MLQGNTISLPPVAVPGTLPMTNQWQMSDTNAVSWTNMVDGGHIIGSQSNVLTIVNAQPSDAGDYQLTITNGSGDRQRRGHFTVVPLPLNFSNNDLFWTANDNARYNNGLLTLTDPSVGGTASFFSQYPQYIGASVFVHITGAIRRQRSRGRLHLLFAERIRGALPLWQKP